MENLPHHDPKTEVVIPTFSDAYKMVEKLEKQLASRYNNKRIVKSIQTIGVGRLLPGMILTFNYSEQGVMDPRPILLYLNTDKETKNIEGLNMNYLNATKLKSYLVSLILRKLNR